MAFRRCLFLFLAATVCVQVRADLYCEEENCYEVLGLERSDELSQRQIKKAYRNLALLYHPDKNPDDREAAEKSFRRVARAYEIISDEETRADYDYFLDNPQAHMYNHYLYYKRRYNVPRLDVVLLGFFGIMTLLKYFGESNKYNEALRALKIHHTELKAQAKTLGLERYREAGGKFGTKGKQKAKGTANDGRTLEQFQTEALDELALTMDIGGGYKKPTWRSLFVVQCAMFPWHFFKWVWWHAQWVYRFNIKGEPYDEEANIYRTRRALGYSEEKWRFVKPEEQQEMLRSELWIEGNLVAFKEAEEKRQISKLGTARQKQYMRWKKRKDE